VNRGRAPGIAQWRVIHVDRLQEKQRIRDTPRTDNHFIQGHLEPALPVRLPHSPKEEKVNEGTTDLNAANPPSFAAKTP